jgi:hypothetical protein
MNAHEFFQKRTVRIPFAGCHIWTGYVNAGGYGWVTINRKNISAHRLAYESFIGPIAAKKYVCHSCDVPACCNPNHLFLGSSKDNAIDRAAKKRSSPRIGSANGRANLNEHQVAQIKVNLLSGKKMIDLALHYGVSYSAISHIKTGRTWGHV